MLFLQLKRATVPLPTAALLAPVAVNSVARFTCNGSTQATIKFASFALLKSVFLGRMERQARTKAAKRLEPGGNIRKYAPRVVSRQLGTVERGNLGIGGHVLKLDLQLGAQLKAGNELVLTASIAHIAHPNLNIVFFGLELHF